MALRPLLMLLASLWAATLITTDAIAKDKHTPRASASLSNKSKTYQACQYKKTSRACSHATSKSRNTKAKAFRRGSWVITNEVAATPGPMSRMIDIAEQFNGLSERGDRTTLAQFFNETLDISIDPRRTAWCAAFVNGVLAKAGQETTGSIEGRSFIDWGHAVKTPEEGDVVVMKGVSRRSPTHVGFYVGSAKVNGKTYYRILGGNQSNMVKISWFPASKVITIRRAG